MMNSSLGQQPNRVTAILEIGELGFEIAPNDAKPTIEFGLKVDRLRFDIARNATLAELSEQVCVLSERHGGIPLSVKIEVAVEKPH
jgi:hypothetical protein